MDYYKELISYKEKLQYDNDDLMMITMVMIMTMMKNQIDE